MSRYGYYGYGYNRYSSSSESQHNQRILRAFEQPLQLLRCRYFPNSSKWEIHISSSTGQGSYELNLTSKTGKCNCPDFERRHKPCKHMLCVLLRILKLKDHEFTSVKQVGKSYDEITTSFLKLFHHEEAPTPPSNDLLEDGTKKKKGRKRKAVTEEAEPIKIEQIPTDPNANNEPIVDKENNPLPAEEAAPPTEEMCIICLLEFQSNEENVMKCGSHCNRWLGHKDCLKTWFEKSILCPLCKGPQPQSKPSGGPSVKRARYGYAYDDDEVDIEALQAQVQAAELLPAFFEIVRE